MGQRDAIHAVLGQGGLLSRAIAGYEHRPEQIQMAQLVKRALDEQRFAVVEAGTGTGKTLAYLLPAALSGRKVVISTATKTLQEQIVLKDIPLLREAAALDFTVTVMKGRANYLCLAKHERAVDDPVHTFKSMQDARAFSLVVDWARQTEEGDRAELDLPDGSPLWRELSATAETCTGQRCPLYESCFVTKMRKRAAESDLIIVNHHLFFADLALKTARSNPGAEVIPRYDAVIFDEAHALEDVATEYFGVGASNFRVDELVHDAERLFDEDDPDLAAASPLLSKLEVVSQSLFDEVGRYFPRGNEQPLRLNPAMTDKLRGAAEDLSVTLEALKGRLSQAVNPDAQGIARRAGEIASDIGFLVDARDPGFVYWAEARNRGRFLRAAPIDVAKELAERLYPLVDTAVFTSATLAAQGKFDFVKRRLGLADPETGEDRYAVDVLKLDSPFDYRTQAALYLPTHLPEASDPAFVNEVAEEIFALCALTEGRAFALFTSLRNMTEAHRLLKDRLPYRVLLQGERPKQALIAEFRERPSVLFAAHSFWEGVDIAGEALSLVIIDKLPFASPTDPVVSARVDLLRSRGHEPFSEYQVPQAALALRQGFGRLIRSRRDRGIVAVLDRRLSTKSYGKAFLESLPRTPRTGDLSVIAGWWRKKQLELAQEAAKAPSP